MIFLCLFSQSSSTKMAGFLLEVKQRISYVLKSAMKVSKRNQNTKKKAPESVVGFLPDASRSWKKKLNLRKLERG
jgi:hypothetical protein